MPDGDANQVLRKISVIEEIVFLRKIYLPESYGASYAKRPFTQDVFSRSVGAVF